MSCNKRYTKIYSKLIGKLRLIENDETKWLGPSAGVGKDIYIDLPPTEEEETLAVILAAKKELGILAKPTQPEVALPEPTQPKVGLPEPTQPEVALPEPTQPEVALPEPTQPEVALPEPLDLTVALFEPTIGLGTLFQRAIVPTPHGTIAMMLDENLRIDITLNQAVRIINFKANIVLTLDHKGDSVGLIHPIGRIYQRLNHKNNNEVEILTMDIRGEGNRRLAKISERGVSFSADNCDQAFLVSEIGTRLCRETFQDLKSDFTLPLFYEGSCHGPGYENQCREIIKSTGYYWRSENGIQHWDVNGVRVNLAPDGSYKVIRKIDNEVYLLRTSMINNSIYLSTPYVYCTASSSKIRLRSHLFVRCGAKRVFSNGYLLEARNETKSAGFTACQNLIVT